MIGEPGLFCNHREIGPNALLTPLVLVKGDIETEPTVIPEPAMASFHPFPGKIQVLPIADPVIVRIILDIYIIWRRGDDEVDAFIGNVLRQKYILVEDRTLPDS
jgi:hypothetical protein